MLVLFTIEDDDDLFLYEEDDCIVAFGENETIEALIVILSLILILSRSLKLFFFFCVYFFFSLLCFGVCLCGLLIWLSVVFYINPEKKESKKKQKKRSSFRGTFWCKIRQTLSFFFLVKKDDFEPKSGFIFTSRHSFEHTQHTHEQEHVIISSSSNIKCRITRACKPRSSSPSAKR